MIRARRLAAAVAVGGTLGCAALGLAGGRLAVAQQQPAGQQQPVGQQPAAQGQQQPGGQPPGGQQPAGQGAAGAGPSSTASTILDPPEVQQAARDGLVVVAEKAAILDRLKAFSSPKPPPVSDLVAAVDLGTADTTADLLAELVDLDARGDQILSVLEYQQIGLSREVTEVLGGFDEAGLARLRAGDTGFVEAGIYLSAADDLASRDGRPPPDNVRTRVEPAALVAAYREADAATPPSSSTSTTPAAGPAASPPGGARPAGPTSTVAVATAAASTTAGGLGGLVLLIGALVVAVAIGVAVVLVRGRKAKASVPYDELLEVSRTLALARTPADVERVAAQEAARLVGTRSTATGAVLRRATTGLEVGYETLEGVLVPDRLGEGMLRRVVDTGQPVAQVVTHEPAVRSLPSAVVAVPVIGAGRVDGLVIAVRSPDAPFTDDEVSLLAKLGPIVAAALDSARHADASTAASLTDPLTQVGNRRKLEKDLTEHLLGATGTTALVMVDLDHFKQVNDTHGHPAGDALLVGVAGVLQEVVRPGDGVYRYGGEEFALVLRDADVASATVAAERAREALRGREFDVGSGARLRVTASLGVAATTDADDLDGLGLIARADQGLYEAKRSGRDRVVASSASPA
ncbi:MAG: sensor domain-containing diguanylate cyclase [Acidimicrobiales bacterium]